MGDQAGWHRYDQGKSIGTSGSEKGVILRDDEHGADARISLERDTSVAPFAITSGLYGWFFHTRFFGSQVEADTAFSEMKTEMEKIIAPLPNAEAGRKEAESAVLDAISRFVDRFPT